MNKLRPNTKKEAEKFHNSKKEATFAANFRNFPGTEKRLKGK
jgi:hypothetical protein